MATENATPPKMSITRKQELVKQLEKIKDEFISHKEDFLYAMNGDNTIILSGHTTMSFELCVMNNLIIK